MPAPRKTLPVDVKRDRLTTASLVIGTLAAILSVYTYLDLGRRPLRAEAEQDYNQATALIEKAIAFQSAHEPRLVLLEKLDRHLRYAEILNPSDRRKELYQGILDLYRRKFPLAVDELTIAVSRYPDHADARMFLALALKATGDEARAADSFEEALKAQPGYIPVCPALAYGWFRYHREEFDAAELLFEASRQCPEVALESLSDLAAVHAVQGKFQQALKEIDEALRSDPSNPNLLRNLGGILFSMGDYENAEIAFRLAIDGSSRDKHTYDGLSASLYRQGKVEESDQILDVHWRLGCFLKGFGPQPPCPVLGARPEGQD